jgi:hypothetical protein
METANDLIGLWCTGARYGPGAQSEEMLIFKPDGTGRMEFWNWGLCSADFFRWQVAAPGVIDLVGFRSLELPEVGDVPVEAAVAFRHEGVRFSVAEEDTPSGKRMLVLRIGLPLPYPSELGLRSRALDGWEEPRFSYLFSEGDTGDRSAEAGA